MPWYHLALVAALGIAGSAARSLQDEPAAPRSLEELLEQLRSITGASPGVAPGLLGGAGPGGEREADAPSIRVLRTRDPVEVAQGGAVHSLPYWSPDALLQAGDELRCGRSGHCLVEFADGTGLRITGEAVLRPWTAPGASPRHLELRHLARSMVATLEETPTRLDLPGGYSLAGADARLHLERLDGDHLQLDNSGPATVFLRGALLPAGLTELAAGETILLPVLPILAGSPFLPTQVERVGGAGGPGTAMQVETTDGGGWDYADPWLTLRAPGPEATVARVAGTRILLTPGREWRLRRAPLGQAESKEP